MAGVCAAFALRYRWDLTATRIITVLLGVLIFPVMEVAYVVAWMLIPEEVPFGMQMPYVPPPPPVPPAPPSNPQTLLGPAAVFADDCAGKNPEVLDREQHARQDPAAALDASPFIVDINANRAAAAD